SPGGDAERGEAHAGSMRLPPAGRFHVVNATGTESIATNPGGRVAISANLGYPRIGSERELKRATEAYWSGRLSAAELQETARRLRLQRWREQQESGVEIIPSNDFSLYDHVLDT